MAEVEIPDVLCPAGLLFVGVGLEDERLFLTAQFEPRRVTGNVLIEGEITCLEGGEYMHMQR